MILGNDEQINDPQDLNMDIYQNENNINYNYNEFNDMNHDQIYNQFNNDNNEEMLIDYQKPKF